MALEGFTQFAVLDVLLDVGYVVVLELAVVKPLHGVINVETFLGLGSRLDVPDDQLFVQGLRYTLGQHGLAGARLALYQQWFAQSDRDVDAVAQLVADYILG